MTVILTVVCLTFVFMFIGALREVLKAKKYSDLTVNLFGKSLCMYMCTTSLCQTNETSSGTLAENNRLIRAQGVVKAYMTIMSAFRGEVPCTVTTATVSKSQ